MKQQECCEGKSGSSTPYFDPAIQLKQPRSVESVEEEELEDDDMKDVSTTDATTDATTNATTEADAVPSGAKADDVQH